MLVQILNRNWGAIGKGNAVKNIKEIDYLGQQVHTYWNEACDNLK